MAKKEAKPAATETPVSIDSLEELGAHKDIIVPPVLEMRGGMISILIHDYDMAEDSFTITSILQGIGNNLQRQKIKAEDILLDLELQEKHNLEGKFDEEGTRIQAPKTDEHGNLVGLSDNQQILFDKLDAQLSCISFAYVDLQKFWDDNNENPSYKLFYQTDNERRIASAKYQSDKVQKNNGATADESRILREKRKAEREARFATAH